MALAISEVRGIVERACARQDVLDACARRDLGAVITLLKAHGITQGMIAELTGLPQGRLSEGASLVVILMSSLGLWVAIWEALSQVAALL